VYGRRATPYQVLSEFAQRIGGAYSHQEVLPQMAHIVAAGTGAEQVVVWLRVGDQLHPAAWSGGSPDAAPLDVDGHALPTLPGADISVPVVHGGDLLGAISIRMPKGEPLRPAGQQLVADVASQAGLVLANASLVEDLRASRQRLVAGGRPSTHKAATPLARHRQRRTHPLGRIGRRSGRGRRRTRPARR